MKRLILTQENRLASIRDVNPKTNTRRVIVPQPPKETVRIIHNLDGWFGYDKNHRVCWNGKPKHQVGDILAMPEPYQITNTFGIHRGLEVTYLDSEETQLVVLTLEEYKLWENRKKPYMKTSARFMYDSLVRYWFKVKRVRVEKLQDITNEDIQAEGAAEFGCTTHRLNFQILWDSINKKRGYGWDKNDWVWVYDYERTEVKK